MIAQRRARDDENLDVTSFPRFINYSSYVCWSPKDLVFLSISYPPTIHAPVIFIPTSSWPYQKCLLPWPRPFELARRVSIKILWVFFYKEENIRNGDTTGSVTVVVWISNHFSFIRLSETHTKRSRKTHTQLLTQMGQTTQRQKTTKPSQEKKRKIQVYIEETNLTRAPRRQRGLRHGLAENSL